MGVPKPTEMTIRDLLQQELRKEEYVIPVLANEIEQLKALMQG